MTISNERPDAANLQAAGRWSDLADRVLAGHRLTAEEGLAVVRSGDEELLDLLAAAYRIRYRWFGNRVHLNFLINAKCGGCGEDCGYCSQSNVSMAEIPRYGLIGPDEILDGARQAAQRRSKTYCIVTSGRQPGRQELDLLMDVVPRIKASYGLKVCASPGFLTPDDAVRLKAAGLDRVNHNLNTSRRFYPQICTTHCYDDRLGTLRAVRQAGMEICSGGIIGMGEEDADVVDLALTLGELAVEAVPINFFQPIVGTPLGTGRRTYSVLQGSPHTPCADIRHTDHASMVPGAGDNKNAEVILRTSLGTGEETTVALTKGTVPFSSDENRDSPPLAPFSSDENRDSPPLVPSPVPAGAGRLNPRYCLKVLSLVRLANPRCELRIAAGREMHLGSLQPLGLYPANSIFVGDYLTTKGQSPEEDFRMIESLGFDVAEG